MLMILGFRSRKFGLGFRAILTTEIMAVSNDRKRGVNYRFEADTILIHGTAKKKYITNDQLLRYFKSGVNQEGYWNSLHVKPQLEDMHDYLTVLYPSFDFTVFYDQYSGHTKIRVDSLIPLI